LSPFFDALADSPRVELSVLEHVPAALTRRGNTMPEDPSARSRPYRLEPLPTYFYNRRHACAQVLSRRFRQVLAEIEPDIIYVLGEPGYLSTYQVVRFARRRLNGASICLFTAQNVYQRFPPPFPSIERGVLRHIDHAFPIGHDHENVLRRKGYRGPATHLPLGVDTSLFTPGGPCAYAVETDLPRPVVGYVGDFLSARDLPLLIEAVRLCPIPVGLLLVGDGPSRPALEALAEKQGIHDRVKFAGRVPHAGVPGYLHCMDVLVLPSKTVRNRCFGVFQIANAEQFGRVLVEAMACGKPVIGSTCGEIPRVIGDAGRVFPEGNKHLLAAALEEICSDPAARDRLGQAGIVRARTRYDWRVVARQALSAIDGMLAGAPEKRHAGSDGGQAALGAAADWVPEHRRDPRPGGWAEDLSSPSGQTRS
jgi:glycosyltransferase involved in cell wall biosynthesis